MYSVPLSSMDLPPTSLLLHPYGVSNRLDRNAVRSKFVRIQIYLILFDEPSQARHLGHSFDTRKLIAKIPVLQTSELREIISGIFIHECVLKYPSDSRGIGPEDRSHALRQAT